MAKRPVLVILAALAWLFAGLPGALAQTVDFGEFDRFAQSVEVAISNDRLPEAGFEQLRASLVEWRAKLLAARDVNSVRIEALEAQLEALGPAPPEGETEATAVASRRSELRRDLEEARAPQIEAVEAHARADALIGRIDATLRDRQTDALFELGRTPLDPTLWPPAVSDLAGVVQDIRSEVSGASPGEADRGELWQRGALAALLLGVAILLIHRGPRLVERLLARIETRAGVHGTIVYGFLVSFAGVIVAMAGISLINAALISTGILGETGRAAAIGINAAILSYAIARWLGGRIFPERESIPTPLALDARQRAVGRANASSLGALAGLLSLQAVLNPSVGFSQDTLGVLMLPVFVLIGLVLFRLGGLVHAGGEVAAEGEPPGFVGSVVRLLGRAVQLVAMAGPVLAGIGFFNLARGLLYPTVVSLVLIAFLMALHYVFRAGYAMLRRLDDDAARQALTPVLLSLVAVLASVPLFALTWGARDSDLGEVWSQFRTGIQLGETTISPADVLTFALVFGLGFGLTRLVQGTLRASVLPRTRIDKGGQNAIISGLGYLGLTIAAIVAITSAGIDLSSLALVVGALGVGIGFGLQNIVNNFVSGIILLIERPIGEGDWVEVGGQMGIVKSISVRSTRIETFDRTDVIVPNGDLISGTVTNWTRGNSLGRLIVRVGVAYGTDTRRVEEILMEIAQAHPLVAVNPAPFVVFQGFGADSLDFEIRVILMDVNYILAVQSEINHQIAERFAAEGIEIPFAQRDVWLRNPEALSGAPARPPETTPPGPAQPPRPVDPAIGHIREEDTDPD